jgi:hypothetical protein
MSFWKHNGWKLRTDLRVMQIQLLADDANAASCGC